MTWGGGGMGGGFGGAPGGFGRPAAPGLPFAGIPSELQTGVDRLLESEPEHPEPDAVFSQTASERELRRLNLWRLLTKYRAMLLLSAFLIAVIAVASQAGPKLTEIAINDGIVHKNFAVVAAMAGVYVLAVVITAVAQRFQVRVSGRLAAWVMNDLRVQIFAHLQRLSLGFFTEEKAGVIMSRMTSDIENLQQLLQDGLSQLAIQALTMVVITVILFTTSVPLAAITVLLIVPALVIASLWFKRASERGYVRVRDGIANVLADLDESLHGVRIVTAHNRQRHNIVHHRNVVGDYRDANVYTAHVNALYGPGTQMLSVLGQAALLGIGGLNGAPPLVVDRRAGRLLPLPGPLPPADPAPRPAVQHLPAGAGLDHQAPDARRHPARSPRGARCDRASPDHRPDRLRRRLVRLRPLGPGPRRRRPHRRAG